MKLLLPLFAAFTLVTTLCADVPTAQSLVPADFKDAKQPQVAVSPNGTIFVVFGKETSIYVTTSTDHGSTFSAPARVGEVSGMPLGMRRGPRVAATDKRVLITAPGQDLISFISDDGGATWSQRLVVNDKSTSAREGLDNITALPDGSFYAVWLDDRAGHKQLEGARLDSGATAWNSNVVVYKSPEKTICECCHPSIVSDGKGKLVAMWRNALEGNRDFYLAESTDRGDTFSPATKLGTGSWKLNACPMDGGNLVASDAGVTTIWRRMSDVYIDKPGEPETKIASGMQPVLAQINGDIFCAWQAKGDLVVTRHSGSTPVVSFQGNYPSLAVSPDGKEGYLVWESPSVPQFAVLR